MTQQRDEAAVMQQAARQAAIGAIKRAEKRENLALNLALNVGVPAVVLSELSSHDRLGPTTALLLGLAFPLAYGLYDLAQRRKVNLLAVMGVLGVLLTGGIALLQLQPQWLALKEAALPFILGMAMLASLKTNSPFMKTMLANFINAPRIYAALESGEGMAAFERRLVWATWLLAGAFFVSAALNYLLARLVVVSQPGTAEFTAELGRMTALSVPVIGLPMSLFIGLAGLAIWQGIRRQTGLGLFSLFS